MTDSRRPNILVRLWLGFWHGLTAFRMAVFNILFLIVLALIIGLILAPEDKLIIEDDTTLVLAPRGDIVEEYTGTPVERMLNEALGQEEPETRLRDIVSALERAADDDRIDRILVQTDELWGMGVGVMADLSDAFAAYRESGKEVIAHGGFMGQAQYFLASQADEIWLDQDGMVLLEGFARYRNYYREGLDRLDVEVNVFRQGDYKSAMEPWERSDMSPADREASEFWLGGLWQDYVETVAMNRGLPADVLIDIVDNLPEHLARADGDPARMALDTGLVDRLVSRPELRAELARRGAPDEHDGFRQLGFRQFDREKRGMRVTADRVGIIVAEGM
ncbi:MAG: S49 family peptidase, partial [Wenzhouxiangella sp.]